MKETCRQFGENRELAGILTEPTSPVLPRRTAVVLISAGLVPKFGPFRLYVELARRLSLDGFVTLRFDLGGIGDSRQAHGPLPLKARTELEIRAALDYVSQCPDVDAIVLGGLCSGAEDSFRAAELDERVQGVVMIDPFGYRTPRFFVRYFLHRVARRARRILGLYRPYPRTRVVVSGVAGQGKSLVNYKYMDITESSRILRVLLVRHVHVHFVYTGGALEVFNHERQLQAMFKGIDFCGLVTLDHFPDMDHTQMLADHRHRLVDAIARRLWDACEPAGYGSTRAHDSAVASSASRTSATSSNEWQRAAWSKI